MAIVIIKPNPATSLPVMIPDLGFPIVDLTGVSLTDPDEISGAQESTDLRALLVDNAHGVGSSTLKLNDGSGDIPQADVLNFIDTVALPETGPYSANVTDDVGQSNVEDLNLVDTSGGGALDERDLSYRDGSFVLQDSTGAFDPRLVDRADHASIDDLVHGLAEDSYQEITRTAGAVTSVVVWTDSGKTVKIRETTITRSGGQVSQTVEEQYDGAGLLIQTLTSTFTRVSGQVTSVDVVES